MKLYLQLLLILFTAVSAQDPTPAPTPTPPPAVEANDKSSATSKVVELLEALEVKCKEDKVEENRVFQSFKQWCEGTEADSMQHISNLEEQIGEQETLIGELISQIADHGASIDDEKVRIADAETELRRLKEDRASAKAAFDTSDADMTAGLKSIDDAINTLRTARDNLSFLQKSKVQDAIVFADALGIRVNAKAVQSFLQNPRRSLREEEDHAVAETTGETAYSTKSGGILEILADLKNDFTTNRDTARKEEVTSNAAHNTNVQTQTAKKSSATAELERRERLKRNAVALKEKTEQEKADAEKDKEATETYKQETESLREDKDRTFNTRQKVRASELGALGKAIAIVKHLVVTKTTGDTVRLLHQESARVRYVQAIVHSPKALATIEQEAEAADAAEGGNGTPALVQIRKQVSLRGAFEPDDGSREAVVESLKRDGARYKSAMLTGLASRIGSSEDVFRKIKGLIREMIAKLQEEASNEADNHAVCQDQKDTITTQRTEAKQSVADNNGALAAAEVEEMELNKLLAETVHSIDELTAKKDLAEQERLDEQATNRDTSTTAEEGLQGITAAIGVLKSFYEDHAPALVAKAPIDDAPSTGFDIDEDYTGQQDTNTGILGMMDVIKTDFERTISTTQVDEATQAKLHAEFMTETRSLLEEKSIIKTDTQSRLTENEGEQTDKTDQLTIAQAKLDSAIEAEIVYMRECVNTGQGFEERTAMREKEIKSLRKAMCILKHYGDEGAAADC